MQRKAYVIRETVVIASLLFDHSFSPFLQYNLLHVDLLPEPYKCIDSEKSLFDFGLN